MKLWRVSIKMAFKVKSKKQREWIDDKNFKVTTLPDEKILSKEGKWSLVSYTNQNTKKTSYAVSDGFKVDFLTIYDDGSVAYDNPYVIPQKVRTKFENEIQRETNPDEYFLGKNPRKHKDYWFVDVRGVEKD